jgi:hypothetical protein
MNRQEITEILESIGVTRLALRPHSWEGNLAVFEKFAALVAAKERANCLAAIKAVDDGEAPEYAICRAAVRDQDDASARGSQQ